MAITKHDEFTITTSPDEDIFQAKIVVFLLMFGVIIWALSRTGVFDGSAPASRSSASATSSARSFEVGSEVTLRDPTGGSLVLLYLSLDAFKEAQKLSIAGDELGMKQLERAGFIGLVSHGERVRILDIHPWNGVYKVRRSNGATAYVDTKSVR